MNIGFSTCEHWVSLSELKTTVTEDQGNWLDDNALDPKDTEAAWVVLDPENAPEYLSITIGCETEEFLFQIDLTGATPVLQDEDGRILYIRKKGGVNHVERTGQRTISQSTQTL